MRVKIAKRGEYIWTISEVFRGLFYGLFSFHLRLGLLCVVDPLHKITRKSIQACADDVTTSDLVKCEG